MKKGQILAVGDIVGYVTVEPGAEEQETYEVACWYRNHRLLPGVYPVKVVYREYESGWCETKVPRDDYRRYRYVARADIPSVITDACFVSLFGGVQYGPDTAGAREIGQQQTFPLSTTWNAHHTETECDKAGQPFGYFIPDHITFEEVCYEQQ
jgi:hypothetical protein